MSSRTGAVVIVLLLSGLMVHCGGGNVNLSRSIPMSAAGWQAGEEDETYDRDTLYGYMNGGAEVYLAFDFREVFVRRYGRDGAEDIVLDVYDMGSPAEAYGVFSCDREDPEAGIGQGSEYGFGLLRFWQSRFFVTIMTTGEDEAADAAILDLGRAVADELGPDGEPPAMLRLLPTDGLIDDRTSYFHSNINLNNRYFIASENILGLGDDTDCVFAEYRGDGAESVKVLMVNYPDSARAETAFDSFIQGFMPEAGESGLAQMEDGGWTLANVHNGYLSIVFDASTEESARRIASTIGLNAMGASE
jgi:hypothetical protein